MEYHRAGLRVYLAGVNMIGTAAAFKEAHGTYDLRRGSITDARRSYTEPLQVQCHISAVLHRCLFFFFFDNSSSVCLPCLPRR